MHVAEAGKGPPVVLLHGYPETWYAWRNQWPNLARDYHVIMPDLRGYGDSDKPDSGYDKRTMAEDVRQLVAHFGYDRIGLIGHDRGARVATRFAKDHRQMVDRLAVLDNIPTRVVFNSTDAKLARLYYWFFYFQQVPHLPREALIEGREEDISFGISIAHGVTIRPQSMNSPSRSTCALIPSRDLGAWRVSMTIVLVRSNLQQDVEDADDLTECPVLALWGRGF